MWPRYFNDTSNIYGNLISQQLRPGTRSTLNRRNKTVRYNNVPPITSSRRWSARNALNASSNNQVSVTRFLEGEYNRLRAGGAGLSRCVNETFFRGFGFITFVNLEDSDKAVTHEPHILDGKKVS